MSKHPELRLVDAVCAACGAAHTLRSTAGSLTVDVCSSCHPAYTGRRQALVAGDRVERFERRRALAVA